MSDDPKADSQRRLQIARLTTWTIVGGALAWCAQALVLSQVGRSMGEYQSVSGAVLLGMIGGVVVPRALPSSATTFYLCIAVVLGNILRIAFDMTFKDPTSHNLAPFEIILSLIVGAIVIPLLTYILRACIN